MGFIGETSGSCELRAAVRVAFLGHEQPGRRIPMRPPHAVRTLCLGMVGPRLRRMHAS